MYFTDGLRCAYMLLAVVLQSPSHKSVSKSSKYKMKTLKSSLLIPIDFFSRRNSNAVKASCSKSVFVTSDLNLIIASFAVLLQYSIHFSPSLLSFGSYVSQYSSQVPSGKTY